PRAARQRVGLAPTQPDEHTVAVARPLEHQPAPRTAAAVVRASRSFESDRVLGRAGHESADPPRLLGRAAARPAQQGEWEGDDLGRAQGDARALGGVVMPSVARAAAGTRVCGASAATSRGGRGCGFSLFRSTQTSTIHPAAPSCGGSSRSTSKLRVIDLVPTRPTYV